MAKILADKDIKKLLNTVIIGASEDRLNPNGIELRLGEHVRFHSTDEKGILEEGSFLKVHPGETITISSLETIDFTAEIVGEIFPGKMLMGLVTPTTTMMREGISQVTTKIDAGYRGILNWGLRNGSSKSFIIGYGEPIFKLTIFALEKDEKPDLAYGERKGDKYMDAEEIKDSTRTIPAQIPKDKIVSSSYGKIDPKVQLREAGYPFDYISTELANLEGELKIVTTGHKSLLDKIDTLSDKIDLVFDTFEVTFSQKFNRLVYLLVTAGTLGFSFITFLRSRSISENVIIAAAIFLGLVVIGISLLLNKKKGN